jgi:hypothetical protein
VPIVACFRGNGGHPRGRAGMSLIKPWRISA